MKKTVVVLVVLIAGWWGYSKLTASTPHPHVLDTTTRTTTASGTVVGFVDALGSHAWMGIPFAAPPVGELRWRAPQPTPNWSGDLQALQAGNLCPQYASQLSGDGDVPTGGITGVEDCLYLNVWAPADAENLPVMLWLHGGGNSIGHGGSYSGDALATQENVIVVTINYRLGPLGWFSHPALANGDALDDSGNYGTLDAIAALGWARDNIAAFGGDPNNVTLFGESAGAADTLALMASPLAKGLFHRAIVQSGGFRTSTIATAQNFVDDLASGHAFSSREVVNQLLVRDGTAADRNTAKSQQQDTSNSELKSYLYSKTPEEILAVYDGGGFGMINFVQLVADGYVLPKEPAEQIFASADTYNAVPVILGTNRDETALFMVRSPQYVENRLGIFPKLIDESVYLTDVRYGSLAWKARGVDDLARLMTRNQPDSVFAYRFDWDEEGSVMGYDLSTALGAAHGLEIAFAFGSFEGGMGLSYLYPQTPARDALANSMMGYWANFARTGTPGRGSTGKEVEWTPWGKNDQRMIILDTLADSGIRMSDEEVSTASVKAALATDTLVTSTRQRCQLYVQNFVRGGAFDKAEYDGFGAEGCAAFDPQEFAF